MSSSDEVAANEDVEVIHASFFRRKCFWAWVEGVDFATLPLTETKVRCVVERDVLEDIQCKECVVVWERSGLRDSLQGL